MADEGQNQRSSPNGRTLIQRRSYGTKKTRHCRFQNYQNLNETLVLYADRVDTVAVGVRQSEQAGRVKQDKTHKKITHLKPKTVTTLQ